jgi:hypothetical protein
VLFDTQGPLPGYPCTVKGLPPPKGQSNCLQNYDFRTPGPLTLRYALGGSRNIPAVKANLIVGTDKVIGIANKMMGNPDGYNCYSDTKLTKTTQCYGASAIGDGAFLHLDDHVNGFGTFSRLGTVIPRTYILKITNSANKTIQEFKQPKGEQAIRADSAYIVNDMASDPNASYLPAGFYKFHRYKGWNFGIKTGTTNNGFDGLMASWSTQYAAVAWVGYHTRNKAMSGAMEYMTAPIVRSWMLGAHDKISTPVNWNKPSSVKTLPAYVVRTHVGIGSVEPSPSTDLFPGWYTGNTGSTSNKPQTIDVVSNKLATDCTPERARKTIDNAAANSFSVDKFVEGSGGGSAQQNDDVHICGEAQPTISFANPPASCNGSCDFTVIVGQGAHALSSDQFPGTLNLIINGQTVQTHNVSSPGVYTFSGINSSGSQQVTAQVIDSVLYDASTATSTDFSGGGGGSGSIELSVEGAGSGKYKFSWNSISGGSPYQICIDTNITPDFVCSEGSSGDTRTVAGGNRKAYISANNGAQSSTTGF